MEAVHCLEEVLKHETSGVAKVGLLTKIAGNYKRANEEEKCIETAQKALFTMRDVNKTAVRGN